VVNAIAGVGALAFVIAVITLVIILAAYILFSFGGKKKVDNLYILYREITQQAKLETAALGKNYSGPRKLYRMNFPWVGDLREILSAVTKDDTESVAYKKAESRLGQITSLLAQNKRAVPKGDIVGFNRINLGVTFEEMYSPREPTVEEKARLGADSTSVANFGKTVERIALTEYNEVKELLSSCGNFLNVIVYEVDFGWKIPFIWRDRMESTVLAFDNQILDVNSEDGICTLLGAGVEYYAYFEIPSGYPQMPKVIYYALKIMLTNKLMTQLLGETHNVVNTILNYEPNHARERAIKALEQPIQKQIKE
jgi:hypothetical protein